MDEYDRLWGLRQAALGRGDVNLAAEIELHIRTHGLTGPATRPDTTPDMERAVNPVLPVKRGPGRPRKNPIEGTT